MGLAGREVSALDVNATEVTLLPEVLHSKEDYVNQTWDIAVFFESLPQCLAIYVSSQVLDLIICFCS